MATIITRDTGTTAKGTPLTNAELDNNFINLNTELATKQATLVSGTTIKTINGTSVLGSGNIVITAGSTGITSVAALTLATTGTDITSSVANGTTTPVITLNIPTASAANRGALSAADWSTFNNKQAAGTYATETFVGTAIANLVDTAPTTLNTLNELAAALGDDVNFATTVTTAIGLKAPIASPTFIDITVNGGSPIPYSAASLSLSSNQLYLSDYSYNAIYGSPTFSSDGTKMYLCPGDKTLLEYTLSTPGDVSTASLSYTLNLNIASIPETQHRGIFVKPDGTALYFIQVVMVDYMGSPTEKKILSKLTLSTPWDLSSAMPAETPPPTPVSVTSNGITYSGNLTSGFTELYPGASDNMWQATVSWTDPTGLNQWDDQAAQSVTIDEVTYFREIGYNSLGVYSDDACTVESNTWVIVLGNWLEYVGTPTAFTTGTPFSMVFGGTTYTGTLASSFSADYASTATVAWNGTAPSVGASATPSSFTIGSVTYYAIYPKLTSYDYITSGVSIRDTTIKVSNPSYDPMWIDTTEFTTVVSTVVPILMLPIVSSSASADIPSDTVGWTMSSNGYNLYFIHNGWVTQLPLATSWDPTSLEPYDEMGGNISYYPTDSLEQDASLTAISLSPNGNTLYLMYYVNATTKLLVDQLTTAYSLPSVPSASATNYTVFPDWNSAAEPKPLQGWESNTEVSGLTWGIGGTKLYVVSKGTGSTDYTLDNNNMIKVVELDIGSPPANAVINGDLTVTGSAGSLSVDDLTAGPITATTITATTLYATTAGLTTLTALDAQINGSLTASGPVTLYRNTEALNIKNFATGIVVHNFAQGSIWHHSSISNNFTANFTNVTTTDNRIIVCKLILVQGATARIPNAVQIGGAAQTIKWLGSASAPAGTANKVDLVTFTLIRTNSMWTQVLGSLTTYG